MLGPPLRGAWPLRPGPSPDPLQGLMETASHLGMLTSFGRASGRICVCTVARSKTSGDEALEFVCTPLRRSPLFSIEPFQLAPGTVNEKLCPSTRTSVNKETK